MDMDLNLMERLMKSDTCYVCKDLCSNMVFLITCAHRVCTNCLLAIYKARKGTIRCPYCRDTGSKFQSDDYHPKRIDCYGDIEDVVVKPTICILTLRWRMRKFMRSHVRKEKQRAQEKAVPLVAEPPVKVGEASK